MPGFSVSGDDGVKRIHGRIAELADRAKPTVKAELYRDAGGYMVNTVIPLRFREHGPGWPDVRRGGSPLIDRGLLRNANDFRVDGDTLVVGNTQVQARLMNRGGDVVPKAAQWLAIPLSPPLSSTEARTKRLRDFAGAFVLIRGPEGPGLYRRRGRGIERIFAFTKHVTIKERKFLYWGRQVIAAITDRWKRKLLVRTATGGTS